MRRRGGATAARRRGSGARTSIVTDGTVRIMRSDCTTDRMSSPSLRMRLSMGSVISGGASSRSVVTWRSIAVSRSALASSKLTSAESTTLMSRSVMPPIAETTAIVGTAPALRPLGFASSMMRSPTVR